ncbi:hypothetical protein F4818DRAFT_443195 [Hypoxylon cercidicola]|nr:hypothetical protein F4818DRAFT_443195 [Hypoxylon cercidicola]
MSVSGASRTKNHLTEYFAGDSDPRFKFWGMHNAGTTAITWKVSYRPFYSSAEPSSGDIQYLVLKTQKAVMDSGTSRSRALKWADHIVNMVNIPEDPLDASSQRVRNKYWPAWIYLEWVENGTLSNFITRAKELYRTLPNRLLWRLFMCLIRMCIEMAWPPPGPENFGNPRSAIELSRNMRPTGIIHGDLHGGNVMFGAFVGSTRNSEHDIAPPLKLIDFGDARDLNEHSERRRYLERFYRSRGGDEEDRDGDVTMDDQDKPINGYDIFRAEDQIEPMGDTQGAAKNIFDIAKTMLQLTLLDMEVPLRRTSTMEYPAGPNWIINSAAVELLALDETTGAYKYHHDLDVDLRLLICQCLAEDPRDRPTLEQLEASVMDKIARRDFQFYKDKYLSVPGSGDNWVTESDDNMRQIMASTLLDARTS